MQELQLRLKESCRERERLQKQHAGQLAAVGEQVQAQVAAFRSQQMQLRQEVEHELAAASGECLASYEAGMAALQGQLERQAATAERQQGELAAQAARLKGGMQQLLDLLRQRFPSGGPHRSCRSRPDCRSGRRSCCQGTPFQSF